jgi:hypothetical protein
VIPSQVAAVVIVKPRDPEPSPRYPATGIGHAQLRVEIPRWGISTGNASIMSSLLRKHEDFVKIDARRPLRRSGQPPPA